MKDFKVTLLDYIRNAQTVSVAGALGCFEEQSSAQIFRKLQSLPEEERLKKEKGVLKRSFGAGHGSIGDQSFFIFSIKDLPRLATLQLCLPEYLAHLQQSLRRARASRGFYLSDQIENSRMKEKVNRVLLNSFKLYEKMMKAGVPGEDARFILPLATKTNIQTAGNARELNHLWMMSQDENVPSIVKQVADRMLAKAKRCAPSLFKNFGGNYERLAWYPSAQLYGLTNLPIIALIFRNNKEKIVELISKSGVNLLDEIKDKDMLSSAVEHREETMFANLKHVHFDFLISMSLACLHQAIRQRTWNHTLESIYDAVDPDIDARIIFPPKIKESKFKLDYYGQHREMIGLYKELTASGVSESEAIGVIPHSLKIHSLIHVNGWNAIHSIGKRTCTTAQWEIRAIANEMAKIVKEEMPIIGDWVEPQCIAYGQCPELKDCGYYKNRR